MAEIKRILLVEDSFYTASAMKTLLEAKGYFIEHTDDGEKAWNMIQKNDYDLILLDLMVPKKSGIEIFKDLKSNEKTKGIPVIIVTARMDVVKFSKELSGIDMFMKKPFDNIELLNAIEQLLSHKKE